MTARRQPPLRSRARPHEKRLPYMALVKEFTKAFALGALAETQGRGVKANPYAKGTDESHAWAAGWYTARHGRDQ